MNWPELPELVWQQWAAFGGSVAVAYVIGWLRGRHRGATATPLKRVTKSLDRIAVALEKHAK